MLKERERATQLSRTSLDSSRLSTTPQIPRLTRSSVTSRPQVFPPLPAKRSRNMMLSHLTEPGRPSLWTRPLVLSGGGTWSKPRRCRVCCHPQRGTRATLTNADPYGSTESTRVDGKLISALVTWDSKVTTVVSLLGGVTDLTRQKMKNDGVYNDFITIASVSINMSSLCPFKC